MLEIKRKRAINGVTGVDLDLTVKSIPALWSPAASVLLHVREVSIVDTLIHYNMTTLRCGVWISRKVVLSTSNVQVMYER